jgi:hypothetical protein
MTPEEKADFLISRFCKHSRADETTSPKESAKMCALITVDEILNHGAWIGEDLAKNDDRFMNTEEKIQAIRQSIEAETGKECLADKIHPSVFFSWGTNVCSITVGLIDLLPIGEKTDGWVPVSERLPEIGQDVWAYTKNEVIFECEMSERVGLKFYDLHLNDDEVTHWQPRILPSPPKVKAETKQ